MFQPALLALRQNRQDVASALLKALAECCEGTQFIDEFSTEKHL